jgi:hypothetical protein
MQLPRGAVTKKIEVAMKSQLAWQQFWLAAREPMDSGGAIAWDGLLGRSSHCLLEGNVWQG